MPRYFISVVGTRGNGSKKTTVASAARYNVLLIRARAASATAAATSITPRVPASHAWNTQVLTSLGLETFRRWRQVAGLEVWVPVKLLGVQTLRL